MLLGCFYGCHVSDISWATDQSATAGMDGSMQSDLSNYTKSIEKLLRKIYGGHSPETKLTDFKQHVAKWDHERLHNKVVGFIRHYFEVYKSGLGDTNLFVRSDLVTRSQGYDLMLHTV